jgi:predicted ribosomally synthesized peptide with SipW-like signal peptide
MKKILLSLLTIVVVGGAVAGATGAFYNDTETSTGNIFVAGSIDLKVDHTAQTYNGVDCKTCSVDVYSSPATTNVVAASTGASEQGPFPKAAKDVSNPHPAWQNEAALAPGQWIWATDPTTVADTTNGATYTFENKFQWNGSAVSVDLNLALASDNGYKIILNGTTIVDKLSLESTYNPAVPLTASEETAFIGAMVSGENALDIMVWNKPLAGDPVTQNPAGLLFKLNIHRDPAQCEADSAFQKACRLWTEKDLTAGDTFFNFDDVKPGDTGTNVISLHVGTNDAFACLMVKNPKDNENDHLIPEGLAGDNTLGPNGNGELSNDLNVVVWNDTTNDGVHQGSESILYTGGIDTELIQLSLTGGGPTSYVGLAWCAGTQTVDTGTGAISCNGAGMSNQAQTDSFMADVVAYGIQQRNNQGFDCHNVVLP